MSKKLGKVVRRVEQFDVVDKIYKLKERGSSMIRDNKNQRSNSASPDSGDGNGRNGRGSEEDDSSDADDDLFKQPQYRKSTSHTLAQGQAE